ncbi:MAG: hypothetical protein WCK43_09275, partial [bacterium]
ELTIGCHGEYEEGFTLAKKLRKKKNGSTEVMSPRILIVDDEEEIRELYSDFLKGRNYRTVLASSYTEMMAALSLTNLGHSTTGIAK